MFLMPLAYASRIHWQTHVNPFPWTFTTTGNDRLEHLGGVTTGTDFGEGDKITLQVGSASRLQDADGHQITLYKDSSGASALTVLVGVKHNTDTGDMSDAAELLAGAVHVTDAGMDIRTPGHRYPLNGRPIMIRTHNTTTAVKGTDFVVSYLNSSSVRVKNSDRESRLRTTVDATENSAERSFDIDSNGKSTVVPFAQSPVNGGLGLPAPGRGLVLPPHRPHGRAFFVFLPSDAELLNIDGDPIPGYETGHPAKWARLREGQTFSTNPPDGTNGHSTTHAYLVTPSGFAFETLERSFVTLGVSEGVGRPHALNFQRGGVHIQSLSKGRRGPLEFGTADAVLRFTGRQRFDLTVGYTPSATNVRSITRLQIGQGAIQVRGPWPLHGNAATPLGNLLVSGTKKLKIQPFHG